MDFAVFHGIAQEGQSVLVNQEKPDGDEDVVGVAAARVEIGKRHGKQAEQKDADGQRDAPHQFRLMLRVAAADKLGCRDGAAVGNGVDEFGRGADNQAEVLEGNAVVVGFAGRAAVSVAVAQVKRAFVVVQREIAFFGEDNVVVAVFVLFAQEQVFHDAGFGVEGFDEVNPAVALAQTIELARFHHRQFLFLLEDFGVFAAAQLCPRHDPKLHDGNQDGKRYGKLHDGAYPLFQCQSAGEPDRHFAVAPVAGQHGQRADECGQNQQKRRHADDPEADQCQHGIDGDAPVGGTAEQVDCLRGYQHRQEDDENADGGKREFFDEVSLINHRIAARSGKRFGAGGLSAQGFRRPLKWSTIFPTVFRRPLDAKGRLKLPETISIRRINVEFSTKAGTLQPQQAGAQLFVCTETAQLNHPTALALLSSLEEGQTFADTKIPTDNGLQAVAVVRLEKTDRAALNKAAAEAAKWAQNQETVNADTHAFDEAQAAAVAEAFAIAFGNAAYRFDRYKKEAKPAKFSQAVFHTAHEAAVKEALRVAEAQVYGQSLCRDLGNAAPNECTPEFLARTAKAEAEKLGAHAKIIEKDYIKENMGSFWSVAKGSVEDPYLIELSYFGAADKEAAPVVLVGKGITFDTGGISLKPGLNMDEMKFDMCGAATVISTFCVAVKLQLSINLVAIVATCENMPSGAANKPGDVVKSMKGLTIEVLNTDAEGRLILCDALTYAEQFKPKAVIDVATLTGACIIALGHDVSGVMGNNQDLVDSLLAASRNVDDKAWQLPLFETYKDQLKSNFADIPNIGTPGAGTITAATFLSYFTEDYPWAHLDIAGTAWKSGSEKGATGRPVPLLLNYLRNVK